ncbi:MAG: phospholipid carrier-dependent glycosyltransferase [Pedobacter sp.]|nr:MAG: phospholipid carrier-dependent glycosyltransferase [Pedobacter sp.]
MNKFKNWFESNYGIILILLLASILRLYHIDYQSVWLDEICSIMEANPNIAWLDLEATILVSDPHPPLYFAMLKIMFQLFGYTTFVARILSAIIGILGVLSIYLLGKEIVNKRVGLIAALLLAINYFHIYYSQEVRMYGLLLLFTVLSYYRLVIFLKNTTYRNAVWYGLFAGLMIFTQFFGLFVLASQLVILLVVFLRWDKSDKLQFLYKSFVSGALMVLIFLPAINIFIATTKKKYAVFQPTTIDTIKQIFKDFVEKSDALLLMAIALILSYFFFLIKDKTYRDKKKSLIIKVLLFWIFITLLIPIIRSYLVTPMIVSRYFITILPAFIILVAMGIDSVKNKIFRASVVMIFVATTFYVSIFNNDYYNTISKTQFREISEYVVKENNEKDPVISNLSWYLIYLFDRNESNIPIVYGEFEDYVQNIMNNPEAIEPFWYFGAFGNPLKLSEKSNAFLKENFAIVHSLDKFDSWTRHYVPKVENPKEYNIPFDNIVLCNLNDENWFGGVSTNNTILLVDFSTKNMEKLKEATRLQAKNGKSFKIVKIEQSGSFIHIYIDRKPIAHKDSFKFPNSIGLIK